MSEAKHVIPTRQKADSLYSNSDALTAGEDRELDVREVLGYAAVNVFAFGDQPFGISVRGSCSKDGTFVQIGSVSSTPEGALNVICERLQICAPFIKMFLSNPGIDQTSFSLCVYGLPIS